MAGRPKQAATNAGRGKGGISARTIVTALFMLPVLAVLMPSCIVLGVGMAPTVVAYVIDRTAEKYLTITVGLLNICGTLPGLVTLWSRGQTYDNALRIATDPLSLLMAYGAAGVAWSIYLALPMVLGHYYALTSETRLRSLRRRRAELVEAWGEEIAGEAPTTKARR
jgi:hypothetical protein